MTFHLLGVVEYEAVARLQQRLIADAVQRDDDRIVALLCEHPPSITVGRSGSRRHIRLTSEELRHRQLPVKWVSRGGGAVLHAPGQLALYVVAPLANLGVNFVEFKRRLRHSLVTALTELNFKIASASPASCLLGRTGILATIGVGVRHGVTHHGAYLNVCPALTDFEFVDVVDPKLIGGQHKTTLSCLLAEHRQPVKMTSLRAELINQFSAAMGLENFHIVTGHPWLPKSARATRQPLD